MKAKNTGFTFKQFHVNHDQCAMKVGTDGILLGAWAALENAKNILDLGTGSGLIALMLAQRSAPDCQIYGVELDPAAAQQARENAAHSPWQSRVQIIEQDVAQFCQQTELKFDLIVANPPYFAQGVDCRDGQRNQARYTTTQTHADWLNWAENCLSEKGKISFILPFDAAKNLQKNTALYCAQSCFIITKQGKAPQRMLLRFSKQPCETEQSELIIYDENNQYSEAFVQLTKDFYLNF